MELVRIFRSRKSHTDLEIEINEFIQSKKVSIVSIEYEVTSLQSDFDKLEYSALLVYKSLGKTKTQR